MALSNGLIRPGSGLAELLRWPYERAWIDAHLVVLCPVLRATTKLRLFFRPPADVAPESIHHFSHS